MSEKKKFPPLIENFIQVQTRYPDAIVCTEVGSFYEIWQIDDIGHAKEAAQILDVVLTRRDKSDPNSPHMCGFPAFACENHFKKMVAAGKTVVVVSQAVKGKKADQIKNIKREVSQILSPGTVVENISKEKSNYFASLYSEEGFSGVTLIDVSTGELTITELPDGQIQDFLDIKNPSEVLICGDFPFQGKPHQLIHKEKALVNKLSSCGNIFADIYEIKNPTSNPTYAISVLGLEFMRLGTLALGNLLNYLTAYNTLLLKKVGLPEIYSPTDHLHIPPTALMSLDVFRTQNGREDANDTFVGTIDRCKTAMGQRKLRQWIQSPLTDSSKITERHDKVESYIKRGEFLNQLKDVYDFSRLARRMAIKRLMPHEIVHLTNSIKISLTVLEKERVEDEFSLASEIHSFLTDNINVMVADGISELTKDFFKKYLTPGVEKIYSEWKKDEETLNEYKDNLEKLLGCRGKLRINENKESFSLTGPKSIALSAKQQKISINVKSSDIQITEEEWVTLSKSCLLHRHQFLSAAKALWENFQSDFISLYGEKVVALSDKIAELDILSSFALISKERGYVRPIIVETDSAYLNLKGMRHPVVERSRKLMEGFVSNDIFLGQKEKTLVIYGANSSGKSTILKAVALNIIMAQMGCFISASSGSELCVFDSVLTRMSSFDSLSDGYSTFTLEMAELQQALKYKDKKSIFLFDEIGRGTSVEDGEAIAYGTLLYLHDDRNKSITLFATHYHSLVPEISKLESLSLKHVSCYTDEEGNLVFSRKLQAGPGSGSYGIEVAKSCGLPLEIILSASRYKKAHFKVKSSNYNSLVEGSTCEYCKVNPAQQTHHIVEQKQGKIKTYEENGQEKKINDKSNLVMLCATCHERVTRGEITIKRKVKSTSGKFILE